MEEDFKQQPSDLIKVVLFGPESTGKTTLALLLAQYYNEPWVPEYAREYLQEKWDREQKTCVTSDLLPIAKGQMRLENELALKAERLLICDTDLLETKVYSQEYYGGLVDPMLEKYANENSYDLYMLTNIDIPWEADDLRDRPNQRKEMFNAFKQALIDHDRNFIVLSGDLESRLEKAILHIDRLLQQRRAATG